MQTPPPSPQVAMFTWKLSTVLNRIKNHFADFYFLSYGWLYLQFTVTHQVWNSKHTKKKVGQKLSNVHKKKTKIRKWFFNSSVFFVRLLVFEIWSILYQADCIIVRNRPAGRVTHTMHAKSTIHKIYHISKAKYCTKKTPELKNNFQSNAELSWKFGRLNKKNFSQMDKSMNKYFKSKTKNRTKKLKNTITPIMTLCIFWDKHHYWRKNYPKP